MFIEPDIRGTRRGWIEVICGSMFSGKTEELIRRLKRARIAHLQIGIFKPAIDSRFHPAKLVSHDENAFPSTPVDNAAALLELARGLDLVAVDEVQFFNDEILAVCEELALNGTRVIVAGLDMDYTGRPFGPMPKLLAIADYITKLHAICVQCGNMASISFRKSNHGAQVLLGEKDLYEPRCRTCFHQAENDPAA